MSVQAGLGQKRLPSYAMFFFGLFVPTVIVDMKILARRA
jgi:hypothetical protein